MQMTCSADVHESREHAILLQGMPGLDLIEEKQQAGERGPGLTAEQFAAWKQDKDRARQRALQEEMAKRQADVEAGTLAMNGRRPSPSA